MQINQMRAEWSVRNTRIKCKDPWLHVACEHKLSFYINWEKKAYSSLNRIHRFFAQEIWTYITFRFPHFLCANFSIALFRTNMYIPQNKIGYNIFIILILVIGDIRPYTYCTYLRRYLIRVHLHHFYLNNFS